MERKIILFLVLDAVLVCTEAQLLPCDSRLELSRDCCDLPVPFTECINLCNVNNVYTGIPKKCYNKDTSECLKECLVESSNGTLTLSDAFNSNAALDALLVMMEDEVQFQPIIQNGFELCETSISGLPITCDPSNNLGVMLWCVMTQMIANCPQSMLNTSPDCESLNNYLQNCKLGA